MGEKYNGWTNYETWATVLWIGNDESAQMTVRDMVRENPEDGDLARAIKEWVEDNMPELPGFNDNCFPMGLFTDFLNASIKETNFYEIAEKLREE
ncbi:MAG: hypothetical protein E4H14_19420 [Candidatus Thorarchaeota archaeon]|nr:MAG: hypothetical protein E4H14_19420 [Candidatus Thorarchaeota archaeon]